VSARYGLGVFYAASVAVALFFATPTVDRVGSKCAMFAAMISSAVNVGAFLGASVLDTALHAAVSVTGAGGNDNYTTAETATTIATATAAATAATAAATAAATTAGTNAAVDLAALFLTGVGGEVTLWASFLLGSMVGGAGAGLMWSAQG
jgi:hypothetical protein